MTVGQLVTPLFQGRKRGMREKYKPIRTEKNTVKCLLQNWTKMYCCKNIRRPTAAQTREDVDEKERDVLFEDRQGDIC